MLNEKKLVERTGLESLHARFAQVPPSSAALTDWVDHLHAAIHAAL
jgi:hypothetical protein